MAIYHLNARTGSRDGGQSALAKYHYVTRTGKYRHRKADDQVVALSSGHMPSWASADPALFWAAADEHERANGRLFREIEIALPHEIKEADAVELAKQFAKEITKEGLPYTVAVHQSAGGQNLHAHIVFNERMNDGIDRCAETWFSRANAKNPERGGAVKSLSTRPKSWLIDIRRRWAEIANEALERGGSGASIDHRSLHDQGIVDRLPGVHIGPALKLAQRGKQIQSERALLAVEISEINKRIANDSHRKIEERGEIARIVRTFGATDRGFGESDRAVEHAQPTANRYESANNRESGKDRKNTERPLSNFAKTQRLAVAANAIAELIERSGGGTDRKLDLDLVMARIGSKNNRTTQAVRRQLNSMGCGLYDVGLRSNTTGQFLERLDQPPEQVLGMVPWLAQMNAKDNDIYLRPARSTAHGLILLDDLEDPAALDMDGLTPACVLETSPKNHQAWIRISDNGLSGEHRTRLARMISAHYNADAGSADGVHYGRLAGFTNRKEKHIGSDGRRPWVLVRASNTIRSITDAARGWLRRLSQTITVEREQKQMQEARATLDKSRRDARQALEAALARSEIADKSARDFGAVCSLKRQGYSPDEAAEALMEHPDTERKKDPSDYVSRTVARVWERGR